MSETAKRIWAARGMYTVQPDNRWPSPEPYIRLDLHEAEVAKLRAERDALRAALTIYAQSGNWRLGGCCDPNSPNFTGEAIARAALKGDSDE